MYQKGSCPPLPPSLVNSLPDGRVTASISAPSAAGRRAADLRARENKRLSPPRDMKAARRFFRSARSVAGFVPDRVTTDGHNSYPRAIRSSLGRYVRHRMGVYLNNGLEQDHRGIKGRIRSMRGFKEHEAVDRFCREHDELRNFLRSRSRHNQYVPASRRRRYFLQHARIAMGIMQIA
jgi:putative transposase